MTLALEPGFQANEKPISEAIGDFVLSEKDLMASSPRSPARGTPPGADRDARRQTWRASSTLQAGLGAKRARDFKEQMLAAGLPV